jgi:hypothetical protein
LSSSVLLPFSVPLAFSLLLGGAAFDIIYRIVGRSIKIHETRMPDEWLGLVAEHHELSREGIAELSHLVQRQGYVSLAQAIKWAEKEGEKQRKLEALREEGARKLLERAAEQAGSYALWERMQSISTSTRGKMLELVRLARIEAAAGKKLTANLIMDASAILKFGRKHASALVEQAGRIVKRPG